MAKYLIMPSYFLHIPKTGGTSLTSIIDAFYQPNEIFPYQVWNHLMENQPVDFDYELYRGHFGYGFHRQIGPADCFTFMRNPVERAISHFHHMTVDRLHNNWVYEFPYDSIERLMEEQPWLLSNVQTKHLGIDVDVTSKPPPYYGVIERHSANQQVFEAACRHLQGFKCVGFLETYQKSLNRICGEMGWEKTLAVHENKLPNRPPTGSFPAKVIRKLRSLNEWDYKLYDYARKLFK